MTYLNLPTGYAELSPLSQFYIFLILNKQYTCTVYSVSLNTVQCTVYNVSLYTVHM